MEQNIVYTSPSFPGIEALSCENDFHFGSHIHSGHVVWLNSGGGEHFSLAGSSGILQPGNVSVIEPGVVHSNHPCEGGGRHLRSLYLAPEFFLSLGEMLTGDAARCQNLPTRVFHNPACWRQLLCLHQAIVSNQDQLMVEQLILSLFLEIRTELSDGAAESQGFDSRNDRFDRVIGYLHGNLHEQISLQDLARIGECTSFHIVRLFKEKKGMSPHAYLVQLRLEAARRLLDGGAAIAESALLSGFSDQSHLTRKFKQRYGLTPGRYAWQKRSRQNR